MRAPKFVHGQFVSYLSLTSKHVFHAVVLEAIGDGYYYWVDDGTGKPRPVRAERLKAGPTSPPQQEVA